MSFQDSDTQLLSPVGEEVKMNGDSDDGSLPILKMVPMKTPNTKSGKICGRNKVDSWTISGDIDKAIETIIDNDTEEQEDSSGRQVRISDIPEDFIKKYSTRLCKALELFIDQSKLKENTTVPTDVVHFPGERDDRSFKHQNGILLLDSSSNPIVADGSAKSKIPVKAKKKLPRCNTLSQLLFKKPDRELEFARAVGEVKTKCLVCKITNGATVDRICRFFISVDMLNDEGLDTLHSLDCERELDNMIWWPNQGLLLVSTDADREFVLENGSATLSYRLSLAEEPEICLTETKESFILRAMAELGEENKLLDKVKFFGSYTPVTLITPKKKPDGASVEESDSKKKRKKQVMSPEEKERAKQEKWVKKVKKSNVESEVLILSRARNNVMLRGRGLDKLKTATDEEYNVWTARFLAYLGITDPDTDLTTLAEKVPPVIFANAQMKMLQCKKVDKIKDLRRQQGIEKPVKEKKTGKGTDKRKKRKATDEISQEKPAKKRRRVHFLDSVDPEMNEQKKKKKHGKHKKKSPADENQEPLSWKPMERHVSYPEDAGENSEGEEVVRKKRGPFNFEMYLSSDSEDDGEQLIPHIPEDMDDYPPANLFVY